MGSLSDRTKTYSASYRDDIVTDSPFVFVAAAVTSDVKDDGMRNDRVVFTCSSQIMYVVRKVHHKLQVPKYISKFECVVGVTPAAAWMTRVMFSSLMMG